MKPEQHIPRNALAWILLSQVILVLPHIPRLPVWIFAVYAIAAYWRIMVYQGRWSFPGRWVKAAMTLGGFAGILISFRSLLGLEPTVALLLTAFALKTIELNKRKDAYLLIFLAYFVCATEFLFSQEMLIVLYMAFAITVVTAALIALHQPGKHRFTIQPFKRAAVMLSQAVPLMLVLFFIFPRIDPLWSVPLKSHAAKTGMSDFMSPGNIGKLSQSDELAFRVEFEGEAPDRSELYWRGLVFSRMQLDEWRPIPWQEVPIDERKIQLPSEIEGESYRYSVIMEPTQQKWVYSLDVPVKYSANITDTRGYRLVSLTEIQDRLRYQVNSNPAIVMDAELSDWRKKIELALPRWGSDKTKAFARERYAEAGSPRAYIKSILDFYRQENFYYTLEPAKVDGPFVDGFLFGTREGFCEHYASSFVYLMRAAGIPARIVAGYQGGEVNPVNNTVVVRQLDAHAWAEVWLEGQGWVRIDPTAAVSPDRIRLGLEAVLGNTVSFLADSPLSPLHFRNVQWFNQLRLRYEALTYAWQHFVLSYNSEKQYDFLKRWLGEVNAQRLVTILIGSACLVLLPVFWGLLRSTRPKKRPAETRAYLNFCKKLESIGIERGQGEAPTDFAKRVAELKPNFAMQVADITEDYVNLSYQSMGKETQTYKDAVIEFMSKVKKFDLRE